MRFLIVSRDFLNLAYVGTNGISLIYTRVFLRKILHSHWHHKNVFFFYTLTYSDGYII